MQRALVHLQAAAAYGMAKAATPYTTIFVSAGLAADFIAQLTAAADAMVTSVNDRTQHQSLSKGASGAIRERLSRGRKIVHVLDSLVSVQLENDPQLLGAWHSVKRVTRTRRSSTTAADSPATPVPVSTATS
jgi:hypothetical protein